MKRLYSQQIVSHQGTIEGYLEIEDGKITDLIKGKPTGDYIDYSNDTIYPGFIDVHVHGWGRGSFALEKTAESIIKMGEDQAKEGVTGFLPTTLTDSLAITNQYIEAANEVYGTSINGAACLGLHLEGPFINKEHKGMQKEEYCLNPDLDLMKDFYNKQKDQSMIKLMTMAPELPGGLEVLKFCKEHNIQVSAGHTAASYDDLALMKDYGVGGVTHMYSGMKGFHHRDLGTVGAALMLDDLSCEFAKQTGMTVRHEAFDLAYKVKGPDKIFMTTDCVGLAMMKEPKYHYVRQVKFIPKDDAIVLEYDNGKREEISIDDYDSIRTLEMGYLDSIKNMIKHTPMSKDTIAKLCSFNPAKYINMNHKKGMIMPGYDADFTIVNEDFDLVSTIVAGKSVYQADP